MQLLALFFAAYVAVVSLPGLWAQQADPVPPTDNPSAVAQPVPRLIKLGGELRDLAGKPLTGPLDLHFFIYKDQADAAPLWQETQTLQLDEQGHYTVLLGGMQPEGLPIELFTTGEARWLGVAAGTLPEQPRTLLVSVPYALKATDAEMLGGKPASAYMLAPPAETSTSGGEVSSGGTPAGASAGAASQNLKPGKSGASPKPYATPIATNYIPIFTSDGGALGSSVMYQSGSNIGVGTLTPLATLDVNGRARVGYTGAGGLILTGSQQSSLLLTNAAGAGGFNLGRSLTSDNGQNFFVYDRAAGATRLFIDGSGNLGIGTAAPAALLHVNGKTQVSYTGFAGLTLTGSQQSSLVLTNAAGGGGFTLGRSLSSDNGQNFFVFDRAAGATRLFIDSGGNVGIGTLSPGAKLDVAGNINSNGNLTATGNVTAASFSGDGAYLINLTAANISAGTANINISGNAATATTATSAGTTNALVCTGCVGNTQLGVNYAASASQGGPASNALMLNGSSSSAFQPAGIYAGLGANTFTATQTVSSGNLLLTNGTLDLPQTTGLSKGVLNLGGNPFLHSYGTRNTFLGSNAGSFTSTGSDNTASGQNALGSNSAGQGNTAHGTSTLSANTTGSDNTAIGYLALSSNTSGYYNTASGVYALDQNTSGYYNTASGFQALFYNTTGNTNTAGGFNALARNCYQVADCAASNNTGLGYSAGVPTSDSNANRSGSKNTFIGALSGPGTSTELNNATAIGANAVVSASNALVLGSISGKNGASASVNVGIGTDAPATTLQVVGDIRVGTSGSNGCLQNFGAGTIAGTCSSDARLKTNIQPFSPVLAKLAQLQPVHFNWKAAAHPEYHFGSGTNSGLIAQEVEKVFPELVSADVNGFKQVNYSELPYLMLQAIRELKAENDRLRAEKDEVQRQIAALEARLARLEHPGERAHAAANDEPTNH